MNYLTTDLNMKNTMKNEIGKNRSLMMNMTMKYHEMMTFGPCGDLVTLTLNVTLYVVWVTLTSSTGQSTRLPVWIQPEVYRSHFLAVVYQVVPYEVAEVDHVDQGAG
jgi:hypothetical protein